MVFYARRRRFRRRFRPRFRRRRYSRFRRRGMSRMVRNIVNKSSELKAYDVQLNDVTIGTTGTISDFCEAIPLGTDRDDRIGRRIFVESVHLQFQLTFNPSGLESTTSPVFVRFVMGRSRTTKPTLLSQILFSTGTVNQAFRQIQYYNNVSVPIKKIYKDRRMCLYDPYHNSAIPFVAGSGTIPALAQWLGPHIFDCNYYIRPRCNVYFDSTPQCIRNSLWMMIIASSGALVNFTNCSVRVRFRDA